jgi:hypothetical protein
MAAAVLVRIAATIQHRAPRLFPDEYIYSELARSIAGGRLSIRGEPANFPALLEPLLMAPLWLTGDVQEAFRLIQVMHAVLAALTALPVFLLAKRLNLPRWQQIAVAGLVLLLPAHVYASYLTAESLGLFLATWAVYLAVNALEAGTSRTQASFLAIAFLASLARVQYVVLLPAFLIATLGVCSFRPLATASRFRLTWLLAATAVGGTMLLGSNQILGYYRGVGDLDLDPSSLISWFATDAMLLAWAAGIILIPAALVGLVLGLCKPLEQRQRAFACFTLVFSSLLLAEAALYAANGSDRFQERYLVALCPLVPILFFLGMQRATRVAKISLGIASAALALLVAYVPLSGYATGFGSQDSPFLQAFSQLEQILGEGSAALTASLVGTTLIIVAVCARLGPRFGTPVVCGLAALLLSATSAAAVVADLERDRESRSVFSRKLTWVDQQQIGDTRVLVTPGTARGVVSAELFWNRSLTTVLQMERSETVDAFQRTPVTVDSTGALRANGRPVSGPLLAHEYGSAVELSGQLVARERAASLWRATGVTRLVWLMNGRYFDGSLDWPRTTLTVWPGNTARRGVVCLKFSLPTGKTSILRLRAPSFSAEFTVRGGQARSVAVPVIARRPWQLSISARRPHVAGNRLVSAIAARPRLVPMPPSAKARQEACR